MGISAVFSLVKTDIESVVHCNVIFNVYNLTSFSLSFCIVYSQVLFYSVEFKYGHKFLKNLLHHDPLTLPNKLVNWLLL